MTGVAPAHFRPVAVIDRNGVDESIHFGAVVCLGRSGDIEFSIGDPAVPVYPRSSTKPLQALAMVRAGLSLPPQQLALVCASHNGEAVHLATAREILAGGGLRHRGAYGETDHLSEKIVAGRVSVPDFHATIHAAMGIDPTRNLNAGSRQIGRAHV